MKRMYKLNYLEESLDIWEKNAVIFLICDDINYARSLLSGNGMTTHQNCVLKCIFEWALQNQVKYIYEKFVEALYTIQNFKLLSELGHRINNGLPEDLCILEIKNNPEQLHYINIVRKTLYLVCEELKCDELKILVNFVNRDFQAMEKQFTEYPAEDMEKNLIFWKYSNYFTDSPDNCDVNLIIEHLREMNKEHLSKMLLKVQNLCRRQEISMDTWNDTNKSSSHLKYNMNSDKMGLCVIINQRNFCQPGSRQNPQLKFREGTDNDRDMLDIAFTGLGYRVRILKNLTDKKLKIAIQNILLNDIEVSDSSLVLCILSHGQKDAIYSSNGIPMSVQDIQSCFFGSVCPKLLGKPKIIIIQACQGKNPQHVVGVHSQHKIEMGGELAFDGIELPKPSPPTADLLTYWAAPRGFQSLRMAHKGSPFIQCLSKQLMSCEIPDFLKLITSVNNEVSEMVFTNGIVTMPEVTHSLRKDLVFPYSSEARIRGAIKLFEKRLFEHLLLKLLLRYSAGVMKAKELGKT